MKWSLALTVAALLAVAGDARAAGWHTFGYDVQRRGVGRAEHRLGPARAHRLAERWSTAVGGQINTQPLVARGVPLTAGRTADLVVVGTEQGRLVALDMATGAVVWSRFIGATVPGPIHGCAGYPDQVFGITGTPVIDRAQARVYAVGGDDRAYALALATGDVLPGWPLAVADPLGEHVWGALTLFRGLLYTGVASYCDEPPYTGTVVAIDTRGPRRDATFRVTGDGPGAPYGGGVWGWGGVSVDPRDGHVYVATGNALTVRENDGYAEHVVRLGPHLAVKAASYPFRRTTVGDQDFGSTPVLLDPKGCPPLLTALSKNGEMLIFRRGRIARGPVQRLKVARASSSGGTALLGLPAYDAARRTLYLLNPNDPRHGVYRHGLLAFRVTRGCRLALRWQRPAGVDGLTSAPTVANGVVYFTTGFAGDLRAVDATTGRPLRRIALDAPAVAAPTVVDGALLAAAYDGTVRLYRPRRVTGSATRR